MINYHDILKAFRGEHTENVHALLWGKKIEKNQIQEISGIPPLTFKSYADYLKDCRIYGNTVQNGTPSPQAPVDVVGCGVRTGNLFDKNNVATFKTGYIINDDGQETTSSYSGYTNPCITVEPNTRYTLTGDLAQYDIETATLRYYRAYYYNDNAFLAKSDTLSPSTNAFTTPYNCNRLAIQCQCINDYPNWNTVMLNLGSTALPYEPYGYKIPVTVSYGTSSITTPVYIGTEPLHKIGDYADYVDYKRGVVVRRIKKLVIRGDETGLFNLTGGFSACRIMVNVLPNTYCFSSHFFSSSPVFSYYDVLENSISVAGATSNIYANGLFDSMASIRGFFSNQYSAGTPVTVWYVLAEPEEEPLESLLPIQTIRGTNVLTADTTVQPSEMYIKGKIKEVTA